MFTFDSTVIHTSIKIGWYSKFNRLEYSPSGDSTYTIYHLVYIQQINVSNADSLSLTYALGIKQLVQSWLSLWTHVSSNLVI